jgi:glycylpeptide N-tetradecanoyltransferase
MTLARMIRLHKVPSTPVLASSGLREMEERDVEEVCELFTKFMKRFDMAPVMNKDEIRHHLLSGKGKGEKQKQWSGRRSEQVVWSYVVEVSSSCRG